MKISNRLVLFSLSSTDLWEIVSFPHKKTRPEVEHQEKNSNFAQANTFIMRSLAKKFLLSILIILLNGTLFSQVVDDFSDGNLSENPPWTGELTSFTVNDNFQLQLFMDIIGDSSAWLSTANQMATSCEWRFYIKQQFAPSGNNFSKVYLTADQADLRDPLNGYFLQFGEGGSEDAVELFRQSGFDVFSVCRASDAQISGSFELGVKVVRENSGEWALYIDYSGGDNYLLEATGVDDTYLTTEYFGFFCKFTSSYDQKFFYDNLYIGDITIDPDPPVAQTAQVISDHELQVIFSEYLDQISATDVGNYSVDLGVGNPVSASCVDEIVVLNFSNPLPADIALTLAITGVTDLSGNVMEPTSLAFSWHDTAPWEVVFNELMADPTPAVGLPEFEYAELLNLTNYSLSLSGWTLTIGSSSKLFPESCLIEPNGYLILCDNSAEEALATYGTLAVFSSFSLTNGGQTVTLRDSEGVLVSRVSYTDDWYNDPEKDNGGWSLEQIDPLAPCIGKSNWRASEQTVGGTPGSENSVAGVLFETPKIVSIRVEDSLSLYMTFNQNMDSSSLVNCTAYTVSEGVNAPDSIVAIAPDFSTALLYFSTPFLYETDYVLTTLIDLLNCSGTPLPAGETFPFFRPPPPKAFDVVFNELMVDPEPSVYLPDYEYAELYNQTDYPIVLDEWSVVIGSSEKSFPPGTTILPDNYILLCSEQASEELSSFGTLAFISSFSLVNSAQTLKLFAPDGVLISQVSYSSSWYGDSDKSDGGWSLEQIDAQAPCVGALNWSASESPNGGTPGAENSIVGTTTLLPVISRVRLSDSVTVLVQFNQVMDSLSISDKLAFSVSDNYGSPDSIWTVAPNFTDLYLLYAQPFFREIEYTLTTNKALLNCCGESIPENSSFSFYRPEKAVPFDVVISEIMSDPLPQVGLPNAEFIELYNQSDKRISVNGWRVLLGDSPRTLPDLVMEPFSYAVIIRDQDIALFSEFGETIPVPTLGLANSGMPLSLLDDQGTIIHQIAYSESWFRESYKSDGGWSLEMIDPKNPCGEANNWAGSVSPNGGTPAKENSLFADNPDLESPELLRINYIDDFTISLLFSEQLDSLSLLDPEQYAVEPELGPIEHILPTNFGFTEVTLAFETPLADSIIYTLTLALDSICDCVGNRALAGSSANFAKPASPDSAEVVINELLSNPYGTGDDYIEFYNRSERTVDLSRMTLSKIDINSGEYTTRVLPKFLLFPSSFCCLSKNIEEVESQYLTPNPRALLAFDEMLDFPSSEGEILLAKLENLESVIDYLNYSEDMQFQLLSSTDGVALERASPERPSNEITNWHSAAESVGFGTPGYKNSCSYSTASSSDEFVTVYPEIFSPDSDGYDDLLQIEIKSEKPGSIGSVLIYNSSGHLVRTLVNNELLGDVSTFSWDGLQDNQKRASIGIYIIVVECFELSGSVKQTKKSAVLGGYL